MRRRGCSGGEPHDTTHKPPAQLTHIKSYLQPDSLAQPKPLAPTDYHSSSMGLDSLVHIKKRPAGSMSLSKCTQKCDFKASEAKVVASSHPLSPMPMPPQSCPPPPSTVSRLLHSTRQICRRRPKRTSRCEHHQTGKQKIAHTNPNTNRIRPGSEIHIHFINLL